MLIVEIFSWWYTVGWRQKVAVFRGKLDGVMDYFSIDLLLRTFFSPFRQISAGKVTGSLAVQMQALFDRIVSRFIGAMIRFFMIIMGVVTLCLYAIIGGVLLIAWGVIPVVPLLGIIFFAVGWTPWNL